MLIHCLNGKVCDRSDLGPGDAVYLVLRGCPVRDPHLLKQIMDIHVQGNGPTWREDAPIFQRVHVGPHQVCLVTHPDRSSGARLTIAMSEVEFRERQG